MTRGRAALALLAAAAGAAALAFTWQPGLASLYDDSVSYLLMAQAWSPFHAAPAAVLDAARAERYPPLFPLALAWLDASEDWRVAHALVALCFAASVYLLGAYTARIARSPAVGLAVALVYVLMPGVWLNVKGILTEFPYLALASAALLQHERLRERATRGGAIALGLLLAATILTRTIGVALLAAVAVAEALRYARARERGRLAAMAWAVAIPVLAVGAWYGLRSGAPDPYLVRGGDMVRDTEARGLGWIAAWARVNASAITDAWYNGLLVFWGEPWKPGFAVASLLGLLGAGAALRRARDGASDGLYVIFFIAILLAWPYPGQMYRLAFPIMPLVVALAFWAALALLRTRLGEAHAVRGAAYGAALPLVLCVPAVLFYIVERARMSDDPRPGEDRTSIAEFYRIPSGPAASMSARAQLAVMDDLRRIGAETPVDARVMWYTPAYVALLARRAGAPLERPKDAADLASQVRATGARYIYLAAVHPRDSAHREGHPLDALALAQGFTREVWRRARRAGELESVLLEVRPEAPEIKRGNP